MVNNKEALILNILNLFLILLVFLFLIIGSYFLYLNIPGEPRELEVVVGEEINEIGNQKFSGVKQFYPNMKFNHNKISYMIYPDCNEKKTEGVKKAFGILSNKVSLISFYETLENPDVEIKCSEENKDFIKEDYFIAGEGGAKEIIQSGKYNIINSGVIFLYEDHHFGNLNCNYPSVELHELMHVFGFDHSKDKKSLMFPYLESCDQKLDQSIIDELKRLYSEQNLPDLHFENISVLKKGRYLNFNLTIKNFGTVEAEDVTFSILDDGSIAGVQEVGDLKYGGGIFIKIRNFKLVHKNPSEIVFVIDSKDKIREMNEDNNVAYVELD